TRQMHAADEAVDLLDARDAARVPQDVDDPGVATARQHEQPPPRDVADHRLVVPDPDIRLPRALRGARLLDGEPRLEVRHSLGLARDEHRTIEQERGAALLNDHNTLTV